MKPRLPSGANSGCAGGHLHIAVNRDCKHAMINGQFALAICEKNVFGIPVFFFFFKLGRMFINEFLFLLNCRFSNLESIS